VIPEAEPIEVLKLTVRPLKKDAAKPRESDKDLNNDVFSAKLVAEPSEALRPTERPMDVELARLSEALRDLKSELSQ